MDYLKHKVNGRIFNYSKYLMDTGVFEVYEPLMAKEEVEEESDTTEIEAVLDSVPSSLATKEVVEQILDKAITVKQFNKGGRPRKS